MSKARATSEDGGYWGAAAPHAAAIAVVLGLAAWWSPSPVPTDRLMIVRRPGRTGRLAADAFLALAKERLPAGRDVRK